MTNHEPDDCPPDGECPLCRWMSNRIQRRHGEVQAEREGRPEENERRRRSSLRRVPGGPDDNRQSGSGV